MKNRIRELRAEKNITQLRLSLELEVSQETSVRTKTESICQV